ncbi:unnamed protein product [Rotaria magnacalcarata]|uniref:Uncharacterized protein n=3 Tax=Rotaria magnacalcarata TaxID=392030 RepID=A0A8S2J594_9BILA|nr:unnamed protein product [Rotaria magnacalcarata]
MNYYCKTAPLVHGPSIELYSLHAHIHLAQQVKRHGGLGHTSAFAFESCIRFIERKAHGSTHLGTQIAYWIDLQTIMQNHEVKAPTLTLINEIKWLDGRLGPYHTVLTEQLAAHTPDLNSCNFYIFFHKVMYTENTYAKPYLNRRTNTENVLYNLVLFPSDNSITVVKAKQCSPAENDGFILVQSGKKKFMGVVLEEGTLLQCSEAADRLTKKTVHPEIESDYERNVDKIQSKQNNTTTSAISTLKAVPFTEQNSNIQQRIASTITVSSGHSVPKENDSIPVGLPAATLMSDDCSSVSRSILESKRKNQKRTSNLKHKRRKQSPSGTASIELLDQFNNTDDESDDSEDEQSGNSERYVHPNQSTTDQAPSFVGRPVIEKIKKSKNKSTKISSSVIQQLLSFTSKLESQYLKPILIAQDRLETMTKNLFVNQKKMEKNSSFQQTMEKSEEATNSQPPVYVVQQQQPQPQQTYAVPYQNQVIVAPGKIRDYLPWSILNIFVSFLLAGLIAIFLSITVRRYARENNFIKAKKFSSITLVFNLLASLIGLGIWAYVIFSIVSTALAVSRAVNSNSG